MRVLRFLTLIIMTFAAYSLHAERIPATSFYNYTVATGYTFNNLPGFFAYSLKGACDFIGLRVVNIPGVEACMTENGNWVYVQSGDICADGSFRVPRDHGWCNDIKETCPNKTWTLSSNKATCSRPDNACYTMTGEETVSEEKLLAAIAYGESSTLNVYEEMAVIASATIRRRNAAGLNSVNELVRKYKSFSYAVVDGNERFKKLMCADSENGFEKAYQAARNAIAYWIDYANGGCFWDGYDLKTSGVKHYKYRQGFRYSDPSHDIYSAPEPPHVPVKGRKGGYYDTVYISTAAQGRTVFWKLDDNYLRGEEAVQCR